MGTKFRRTIASIAAIAFISTQCGLGMAAPGPQNLRQETSESDNTASAIGSALGAPDAAQARADAGEAGSAGRMNDDDTAKQAVAHATGADHRFASAVDKIDMQEEGLIETIKQTLIDEYRALDENSTAARLSSFSNEEFLRALKSFFSYTDSESRMFYNEEIVMGVRSILVKAGFYVVDGKIRKQSIEEISRLIAQELLDTNDFVATDYLLICVGQDKGRYNDILYGILNSHGIDFEDRFLLNDVFSQIAHQLGTIEEERESDFGAAGGAAKAQADGGETVQADGGVAGANTSVAPKDAAMDMGMITLTNGAVVPTADLIETMGKLFSFLEDDWNRWLVPHLVEKARGPHGEVWLYDIRRDVFKNFGLGVEDAPHKQQIISAAFEGYGPDMKLVSPITKEQSSALGVRWEEQMVDEYHGRHILEILADKPAFIKGEEVYLPPAEAVCYALTHDSEFYLSVGLTSTRRVSRAGKSSLPEGWNIECRDPSTSDHSPIRVWFFSQSKLYCKELEKEDSSPEVVEDEGAKEAFFKIVKQASDFLILKAKGMLFVQLLQGIVTDVNIPEFRLEILPFQRKCVGVRLCVGETAEIQIVYREESNRNRQVAFRAVIDGAPCGEVSAVTVKNIESDILPHIISKGLDILTANDSGLEQLVVHIKAALTRVHPRYLPSNGDGRMIEAAPAHADGGAVAKMPGELPREGRMIGGGKEARSAAAGAVKALVDGIDIARKERIKVNNTFGVVIQNLSKTANKELRALHPERVAGNRKTKRELNMAFRTYSRVVKAAANDLKKARFTIWLRKYGLQKGLLQNMRGVEQATGEDNINKLTALIALINKYTNDVKTLISECSTKLTAFNKIVSIAKAEYVETLQRISGAQAIGLPAESAAAGEYEELFKERYDSIISGQPLAFHDYPADVIDYFLSRFREIQTTEQKKWILLEADASEGFENMIEEMEQQLIDQAEQFGLNIAIPREGPYAGPYYKFTFILHRVRNSLRQMSDEAMVMLFFKNPEELFRTDIKYEGPMRALASEEGLLMVTHYDPRQLREILSSRGKTSPFENIFLAVTLTDTERNRLNTLLDLLLEKIPEHPRINLTGSRRARKTHMMQKAEDKLQGAIGINLQAWQHRIGQVKDYIDRVLQAASANRTLLIDEAEILLSYPQLWLDIEEIISQKNGKIVYASAKPLLAYLSDTQYSQSGQHQELLQICKDYSIFDIDQAGEPHIAARSAAAGFSAQEARDAVKDEINNLSLSDSMIIEFGPPVGHTLTVSYRDKVRFWVNTGFNKEMVGVDVDRSTGKVFKHRERDIQKLIDARIERVASRSAAGKINLYMIEDEHQRRIIHIEPLYGAVEAEAAGAVLILETDESYRTGLTYILQKGGKEIETTPDVDSAIARLKEGEIAVFIIEPYNLGVYLTETGGLRYNSEKLADYLRKTEPANRPVIVINTVINAGDLPSFMNLQGIKREGIFYLPKGQDNKNILMAIENAIAYQSLDEPQRSKIDEMYSWA